jgi:hypothetical protein
MYDRTDETIRKYIKSAGIKIVYALGRPGIYARDFPRLISEREQKTEGAGVSKETPRRSMATLQNRKGRQDLRASSIYEIESPQRRKGSKTKPTG